MVEIRIIWLVAVLSVSNVFSQVEDIETTPPGSLESPTGGKSPDADLVFTIQPAELTYTSPRKVAKLVCAAIDADDIHIRCNKEYILEDDITTSVVSRNGHTIRTVQTDITKAMIFVWFTPNYWCECIAQMDNGNHEVTSSKGVFKVATLNNRFETSPIDVSVELGEVAQLACRPPRGDPEPSVYWEKNGERINDVSDDRYIVTHDGALIINQATLQTQGNYTCVADNDFFTKTTAPASLHIYTNGGWSTWSAFGECNTSCGNGLQHRFRTCNNPSPSGRDGRACEGNARQSSPCTKQCPPVDGSWSAWGPWGDCTNCQKYRRRSCDSPPPSGSGRSCQGSDLQASNCSDVYCPGRVSSESFVLWMVLCAAVAIFVVILVIIVMCLMRKRNRRGNICEEDSNNADDSSREGDKFTSATTHSERPKSALRTKRSRAHGAGRAERVGSPVEKLQMLNGNHHSLPSSREYYMQISPNANCDHHDYMQISSRDSDNESGEDKLSQHSSSPESGICNSCDRQSLLSGQLPASIDVEALAWANVTHTGAKLSVTDSDISVTVPEGAIGRNQTEEVFIAALREDKDKPALLEKQTLLSPVILCGPHGTTFNKSLIISFDHCASMKLGQWKLSVYCSNSGYDESPQWERLLTLNQEILHAPIFCQLDNNKCHIMVDQLASRYCLVGESMYGSKAVKQLKLAAFSQPLPGAVESNVRVYVLPDTQDALCSVMQQESKLGAKLVDKPKQISFQDGGNNLCLMLTSISNGWASKIPEQYQEIPFRHVWKAQANLHCSFAFERMPNYQSNNTLTCTMDIYQKSVLSNRQQINVNTNYESLKSPKDNVSSTVTVNTQSSSGCSSMVVLDNQNQPLFKLSSAIKKKLGSHLDIMCMRGNDWRMLATALNSDRHLNFFSMKPSPTEALLDLWEARTNSEHASVTELINILNAMGRQEAAVILEKHKSDAWV